METRLTTRGSLGSLIRTARLRDDLSQHDLAARLGVSQGTISFWERNIEVPSLDNLVKLLRQFPELLEPVRLKQTRMIEELRQIERLLFEGRCACENCNCSPETNLPSA